MPGTRLALTELTPWPQSSGQRVSLQLKPMQPECLIKFTSHEIGERSFYWWQAWEDVNSEPSATHIVSERWTIVSETQPLRLEDGH